MPPTVAQTSLRMPEDLHQRLSTAADEAGHSLGEEIRRRLEQSFELAADAETGQLLTQIATAAKLLRQYGGPHFKEMDPPGPKPSTSWHNDPRAFAVFMAAVNIFAAREKQTGEQDGDSGVMFGGTPEEAGARLAIMVDIDLA